MDLKPKSFRLFQNELIICSAMNLLVAILLLSASTNPSNCYAQLDPGEEWTIESETPYPMKFIQLEEKQEREAQQRATIDLSELEQRWMEEDFDEDDIPIDADIHSEIEKAKKTETTPMVFVKLTGDYMIDRGGNASHLSWDALAKVCNNDFLEPLSYAVIDPMCYPIEPDSVMISSKRPWEKDKIWDYFEFEEGIEELAMDGRTVRPVDQREKFINRRGTSYD